MKITRRERERRIGSGGGRGGGGGSYGSLLRRGFAVAIANFGRVSTARVNHGRRCHMYNFGRERERELKSNPNLKAQVLCCYSLLHEITTLSMP